MIGFLKNISNLVRISFVVSKFQLLTHPGNIKMPVIIRLLGYLSCLFLYPISLFITPKEIFAKRFANAITQLGPIYIKLGQTLSTRPDIIGKEIADNLKFLQDKLPPFDFRYAKEIIEKELEGKLEDIFDDFEEEPVAAASIAQVHRAQLKGGQKVAVKILRPNIKQKYSRDVKCLEFLAKIVTAFEKGSQRLKPLEVIQVFKRGMHSELDLTSEAAAAAKLRDNFEKGKGGSKCNHKPGDDYELFIPHIFWNLTSENVLTSEWVDGISIYDHQKLKEMGFDNKKLAKQIAIMFFNMSYRDGFFHADMHPGNILVRFDGSIALIDFGIMGILPEKDRLAIAEILYALLQKNYEKVAKIHIKIGYAPKDTNSDQFALALRKVCDPVIDVAVKDISIGNLLAKLFKISEEYGIEIQPQLVSLQKTIVVVEGIGQSLDPEINMWQLAEPWIKKWAIKNLTPEAKIFRFLKNKIEEFLE